MKCNKCGYDWSNSGDSAHVCGPVKVKQQEQGEPVAYLHDDGYWTAAKTYAGRQLNDRLTFAGSPKIGVYTHLQPKREPLTDEQILHRVDTHVGEPNARYPLKKSDWMNFARAIEAAHGIKE